MYGNNNVYWLDFVINIKTAIGLFLLESLTPYDVVRRWTTEHPGMFQYHFHLWREIIIAMKYYTQIGAKKDDLPTEKTTFLNLWINLL